MDTWWAIFIRVFISFSFYIIVFNILENKRKRREIIEERHRFVARENARRFIDGIDEPKGQKISTLDPYGEENWNN